MSIKLMSQVWGLSLEQGQAWVLMALADSADDHGDRCFPSVAWLAWKTGYSERQVQRLLRELEEDGLIEAAGSKRGGRGRPTPYRLHLEKGVNKSPFREASTAETVTDNVETVTDQPEKGDAVVSPDPKLPIQDSPPGCPNGQPCPPQGEQRGNHLRSRQAREVLAYLNEYAGRRFPAVQANLRLIRARLREGATMEQCRAVIVQQAKAWAGTEMETYLRPATLFNATKFAQYVGALGT